MQKRLNILMLKIINKNDTRQKSRIMFTGEQNQFYIDVVVLSIRIIQKKITKQKIKFLFTFVYKTEIYFTTYIKS